MLRRFSYIHTGYGKNYSRHLILKAKIYERLGRWTKPLIRIKPSLCPNKRVTCQLQRYDTIRKCKLHCFMIWHRILSCIVSNILTINISILLPWKPYQSAGNTKPRMEAAHWPEIHHCIFIAAYSSTFWWRKQDY